MFWPFLVLLIYPSFALETVICYQTTNNYECHAYKGGGLTVFDYPPEWEYSGNNIGYTESEGMNSTENESGYEQREESINSEPSPIPYSKEWRRILGP
jgi:hypothetical protein